MGRDDLMMPVLELPYIMVVLELYQGIDSAKYIYNYNINEDQDGDFDGVINAEDAQKCIHKGMGMPMDTT